MSAARSVARTLRDGYLTARFRAWAAHLDLELRRRGARLILDAPHGLQFDEWPHLKVILRGEGDSTFTLRIGRNVTFGRNLNIEIWAGGTNVLEFGEDSYVMNNCVIQMRGGRFTMGPRSNMRNYVLCKTQGDLIFHDEVSISPWSEVHCAHHVELHDLAATGERVSIMDSEKRHDGTDRHFLSQPLRIKPVVIERNVFMSANAVILYGSHVRRNSVIGAGAILTGGEYPPSSLIVGAPARAVKHLTTGERIAAPSNGAGGAQPAPEVSSR